MIRETLEKLCRHENLSQAESRLLFGQILAGKISEVELTGLLIALKSKGECAEEIAGAAQALRETATAFPKPDYVFADIVGTGGDGAGTINISTAAALVAAQCGLPVAKHGNVSVSSLCGSADLLKSLGAKLDPSPNVARKCLDDAGFCFLFAPAYHVGMRHVMPVRKALGVRTIFNLLGPLANPSQPPIHLVGVYDPRLCMPFAKTLQMLGGTTALVVHGNGIDEIALHGQTTAVLLQNGNLSELVLHPSDAGLPESSIESLKGGDPTDNAKWLNGLLKGKGSQAHQSAVALNAGALLWISGRAKNLKDGTQMALKAIQSGQTFARLNQFVELSNGT